MGLAKRGLTDLQAIVEFLDKERLLARVHSPVDPVHTLAGIATRFEGGKPVLFENVKGHPFPVFIGLYWNRDGLGRLFDVPTRELPFYLARTVAEWQQSPVHPIVVPHGPANEVVEPDVDLSKLPIPTHALEDGGPYIDSAVVIANDPDTGVRNASICRFLVIGKDRLTCQLDEGRHLRDYYERAEARGRSLQITINNGVDLSVHMAAIVPASAAPIDKDELGIASHLLGEPLKLIPGTSVQVDAVATAQVVIEAEMLPKVREPEGPFAEVTGYYAGRGNRWTSRVTGITRRREPIWHTILSGKEVWNAVGLLGEASIYQQVSRMVPAVKAVHLAHGGCGFYHAIVSVRKNAEGIGKNAILATFGVFPSLKFVTVVDEDVDIFNMEDVAWAMAVRLRPETGIITIPEARCHELNPTTHGGLGMKVGFDTTAPFPWESRFTRASVKAVNLAEFEISA